MSRRKITRLSFVMMCLLCGYGVYQVYLFHSQHQELAKHFGNVDKFELYGAFYVQNEAGYKHPRKSPDISLKGQKDNQGGVSLSSLKNGARGEPLFEVSRVPSMRTRSPQIEAYMDAELSDNFMDIRDVDNVDVNAVDSLVSKAGGAKDGNTNFHYPDGGYRYNGAMNKSGLIQVYNLSLAQHISTKTASLNISPVSLIGKSFSNTSLPNYNVAYSNAVKSNVSTIKNSNKLKPVPSYVMPPPINSLAKKSPHEIRYLVYLCDSYWLCGGWGDRQRGMVSSYLLSRLVDRQFKIIMTTPCNLGLFYKPNTVQWHPQSSELLTASNISINALMDKNFQYTIMESDFNSKFPQKVVYLKTIQDYYGKLKKNTFYSSILNQWSGLNSKYSRFHWAWSELMQPSQMILAHLQHIMGTQFLVRKGLISKSTSSSKRTNSTTAIDNSTLICAHVRMGKNPTNPMDESLNSFKLEYLTTLFQFMLAKDRHGDARFFVATDYDHVRSESKRFFGNRVVDYGGKILHIDRQRGEQSACVGFEVALMDQLILSLCDILVVCKSGFSINASFMSNMTGHVHIMKDGVINLFSE